MNEKIKAIWEGLRPFLFACWYLFTGVGLEASLLKIYQAEHAPLWVSFVYPLLTIALFCIIMIETFNITNGRKIR